MSWDTQLNSILTATESNMAKIKERLYSRGELSKDIHFDLPRVKTSLFEEESSKLPVPYLSHTTNVNHLTPSEDLANLSSKLLSQDKMIASLHQALGRLERDRDQQQQRIHSLEDELHHLQGAQVGLTESVLERKVDGLRQELFSELRCIKERLRDYSAREPYHGQHSSSSIIQEMTENKRILWKECESLRRDIDFLHQRFRRQEDDMLRQVSEGQEVKRMHERNAKMLEGIVSNHQTNSVELNRTRSDTQELQRCLLQIRGEIRELKDNLRILEQKINDEYSVQRARSEKSKSSVRKKKSTRMPSLSSADDTASQLSLGDISSEETSYSLDLPVSARGSSSSNKHSSREKTRSILIEDDFSDDLDGLSDSPPELNFSDL
ncbi:hypothetical protein XENTR_v10011947 [Xenopus tropicalis]|uniref:Myosin-2 heavy chain, non muscle n=1 Tax=Xenopus tropicalis TaxID=8364 RepID=A0A8J1JFZ5_XENTR|nr:myosin-2 heavy chain, non muscle [Xenopus tropicalis]XP_031756797.1 myosin-2 heavy chain, non muscle [Xenopus tropicalis]KAE8609918.1 hypothetical protein XENTR_v10011947 [Xenopus tropicalis]|eukprot:XP_002931627.2 PREDICTED: myosin-2 heavy chain, non muscle-like isoform X2 [Xenopus tropicalis]